MIKTTQGQDGRWDNSTALNSHTGNKVLKKVYLHPQAHLFYIVQNTQKSTYMKIRN